MSISKEQAATGLKWAVGIAAAALIAPVIFLAVKGLVGLVLAAAIGLVLVHGAPLASRWLATVTLSGFKGLARSNPVETRQLIAVRRKQELSAVTKALQEFGAEVLNVQRHARGLREAGDIDGANEMDVTASKLQELLDLRKRAYISAVDAVQEYEKTTEKVNRRWQAAQAALKAQKLAGTSASKELDRIMSEEALESVETAMNQVFAGLDSAMLAESVQALTNNPSPVIDVVATRVKEVAR